MSDIPSKKPVFLSASRIECWQNCSQLYAARYIWRLPDSGNDGSRRGSVVHDTLEILAKPRHRKHYESAILHDSCTEVPALWRLVTRFATHYQVNDSANLSLINDFLMVALKSDFFGPAGTYEDIAEKNFEIEIDRGDGRKYRIKGFIDRVFKVRDKQGLILVTMDYKTSKDQFKGEKVTFNHQSLVYQLAERELFPEFLNRQFHFLFLKFPKKARQDQPSFTDEELNGFEWILTEYQGAMDTFTLDNASDNLAVNSQDRKWLCGHEGLKKDGNAAFICGARNPMDYWVALDKNGEIAASATEEADLKMKEGWKAEERHYPGCPAFWNVETGRRRNFS